MRPKAIVSLSESPIWHNWLVYSDAGIGKSVLAGTADKGLFLTVESEGTQSAKVFGSECDEWVIDSLGDFREATDYFLNGTGCSDYSWGLLDSLSEIEDLVWGEVLREGHEKNSKRSLDKAALEDYQIVGSRVQKIVKTWNKLPVNVLYTAQAMRFETEGEDGEEVAKLMPALGSPKNGRLSNKICARVSLVGYLEVKRRKGEEGETEDFRRLYTSARPGIIAKNRSDLGRWVDNPTIPALMLAAAERQGSGGSAGSARPTRSRIKRKAS